MAIGVPHPGLRIKAEVIPVGMTVTNAASLMGVGRPALSNLLNGKAALSPEMAARLEKAFKYPLKDLLEMQAQFEAAQAHDKTAPASAMTYVPPFLAIKANAIEHWVTHNILARSRLAVFLRTLVHSTGDQLTKVDFPGNDDAERPGWDGLVEAGEGTPWIPEGRSGWEFGTNDDYLKKANGDFDKSVKALSDKERKKTTFIFVTPRRWPGKGGWVASKQALKLWKEVRVYDASDLEQWLEQSLPGQAWFANETRIPDQDVRSLDKCWIDWAEAATPALVGSLFESAIEAAKRNVVSYLSSPPDKPMVIAADSIEEALAFLAQLLSERGGDELASHRDRVLVFDKPGVLPRLASAKQAFIPVIHTRDVERELAPYAKSFHSFVIYPRNAAILTPAVILEPASYETFNNALESMNLKRDEITRLSKASGRSLTVLRRRLSLVQAVQLPDWAADPQTATKLVPFLFVGAWETQNDADKLGLSQLAGNRPYEEIEKDCQALAKLNDAPVWSIGTARGVISKIDLLFAAAQSVTEVDLVRYFDVARQVLGEDDPSLDLAEDQRWAALHHGKVRQFSRAFREGISETLVLLAVNGGDLFKQRLGVDVEAQAVAVIRDLLRLPLTTRILEANDHDLPTYAEAAPDELLTILERDLRSDIPAVFGLLRPVSPGMFGASPSRTGLLWALEGLSWSPETLPRAAMILARLAQIEIKDNWLNKPANSLGAIFRAWMPQTAASLQQRVELLKQLVLKFPEVAWGICMAELETHRGFGNYSHKPRWRNDGYGWGEPIEAWEPIEDFLFAVVDIALSWPEYSLTKLCELIVRLPEMTDRDQARVWKLIETWATSQASDAEKAALREKIRVSTLSRRASLRTNRGGDASALAAAGKSAYESLEPSDLLNKHMWLFNNAWIEESADELEDLKNSHLDREERMSRLRGDALREVFSDRGLHGILELAERGNTAWIIGSLAARILLSLPILSELLRLALDTSRSGVSETQSYANLISGALRALPDEAQRTEVLLRVADGLSDEQVSGLLLLAPFNKGTWDLVDTQSESVQGRYWRDVVPDWINDSTVQRDEAVDRLLEAGRPRAAFSSVRYELSKIDPKVLFQLMTEMALGGNELPDQYLLDSHYVEEAFKQIAACPSLSLEQKAGLEFAYIDVLGQRWARRANSSIQNLEQYIELHPDMYVHAICWTYRRKDEATDPEKYQTHPDRKIDAAKRGHKLLEALGRIPGQDESGDIDQLRLASWVDAVRQSCADLSRGDLADSCIGRLLSCAPVGKDDVWPCESVRVVMEHVQSERMMDGAVTGVYNSRGVHMRGEGGGQERELAEKYRAWARELQFSSPFVASKLLMALAKTYDREAHREDTEADIRRRMHS